MIPFPDPADPDPSNPADRKGSMLSSLAPRAEKKMVGRAVTSDLGKKLLREYYHYAEIVAAPG